MQTTDKRGPPEANELEGHLDLLLEKLTAIGRRHSLRDPIATACLDMGLTAPQIHALLWLMLEQTLTMGELSRRVNVTEKTMTGLVDRLELAGLAQRERNDADRRLVRVRLSSKGRKVATEVDQHVRVALGGVLGLLDFSERTFLFEILDRLLTRLDDVAATGTVT